MGHPFALSGHVRHGEAAVPKRNYPKIFLAPLGAEGIPEGYFPIANIPSIFFLRV